MNHARWPGGGWRNHAWGIWPGLPPTSSMSFTMAVGEAPVMSQVPSWDVTPLILPHTGRQLPPHPQPAHSELAQPAEVARTRKLGTQSCLAFEAIYEGLGARGKEHEGATPAGKAM